MGNKFIYPHLRRVFLKEWLAYLNIKQARLAKLMDTTDKNITTWLKDPGLVTIHVISAIADALSPYAPELRDAGNLLRHPESVRSIERVHDAARHLVETLSPQPAKEAAPRPAAQRRKKPSRSGR